MRKSLIFFALISALCMNYEVLAQTFKIDIPFQKYTLKNGLTLIVHEDHKAPIVAVNIWYHVGSKNEKPGKTGFAHLFEHLMFNGSENFDDDYFQALERVGATDLNGTTNEDRTNYFQNVPVSAFDLALWMESDRMGHLLGAVTQAKLDEQRGVVQNEKRQGENEPYALAYELFAKNTYPAGHPYSWTVIGSMEDLNAASLEDVHEWFKNYYGAANAVLVIAGDVNPKEVYEKVEKYFGDIPPGPPVTRYESNIAKMTGVKRMVAQDRVPQSRIYKVWNVPQWGTRDAVMLDLLSDVLSSGKNSRLYKRLVYEEQIATNVSAYIDVREIGSQFYIEATAKPGEDLKKIEKILDEELAKLLKNGPTEKELQRVKTQYFASFVRGIERIGGFGGKSDILAQNMVYGGSPDYYKNTLKMIEEATSADLKNAGNQWLSDGVFILEIHPYPEFTTIASDVDRKKLPQTGETPDAIFPKFEKTTLSNGLKIVFAQRSSVPTVNFRLMVNSGSAADQFGVPGLASMTMDMLDEGAKGRDALQINEELALLGASLGTGAGLDYCTVSLSALKNNLDASLVLFSDVILNPTFPQKELDRLKKEKIAGIKREKASPVSMGLRVFPKLLFGENHAYGLPFSGSGYENTINRITRDDLINYHKTWFKADNATLVIVGDITLEELKPKLEKLFKDWKPGAVPVKNISPVSNPEKPVIYLLDKPAAQQSIIFAGSVIPKRGEDEIAIQTMNNILGGIFTSRINMNLREDKHWSYGSGSTILNTISQRPYLFYGIVQTDKTKESLFEILKEMREIKSTRPATEEELNKLKLNQTLELPGSWETNGAILGSLSEMVTYNLPDDYFAKYSSLVKALDLNAIKASVEKTIFPENVIWVVVGDRAKIEAGLKETGYEIKLIDGDGNIVR